MSCICCTDELEILQSYVGIGDVACSCGLILRCQLGRLKTFSLYVTLSFPSSLSLYEITHTLSLSEKAQLYLCDFDHYKILFALAVMVIRL